jgi:hypothetical protein
MKRVYVLGAGSSIAHSRGMVPSVTGFFPLARKLQLFSTYQFKELVSCVREVLGLKARNQINIEDLFTHIEIELEKGSSSRLLEIRGQLFDLIQLVLSSSEKELSNDEGEYTRLLPKLEPSDTIITFNWDLLLDNVLNRERILSAIETRKVDKDTKSGQYWQFIQHLSARGEETWEHIAISPPYCDWNPNVGYYLKAHGSIDWFYCLNDSCRAFRKVFPTMDYTKPHFCSECHEKLQRLLIPPVLNKGYGQYPLIRRIWNLAAKELNSTNELILWGYSLPPTDFYSFWLLRQTREAPLQRLVIINPSVRRGRRKVRLNSPFVSKFYSIIRGKKPKEIIELYEYFGDYCDGIDILKKYDLGDPEKAFRRL